MLFTRKYNIINNSLGWLVFVISLVTYWLTLEPTASYWDCGEFIIQADKLEIGHPPGNPIFMLTARFFANFAPDASHIALMVNAMSGLLSALTILLLFWTITHLVRRLVMHGSDNAEPSLAKYLAIMGSGVVGALAYAWSDTFWFSAVEGEVYAFSSFCTALVFWLILKWENRADQPGSDRYLVLIAYIIGVSIAVHLLNLLCIPAIVLVFAYRKIKDMNLWKSLVALLISFGIVVLVLYGLVPGFIKVAQGFELFSVNTLGLPFQSGVIIYTVCLVGCLVWTIWEQYTYRSPLRVKISLWLSVLLSGMLLLINIWVGALLMGAFAAVLFVVYNKRELPRRIVGIVSWSILTIFIGYSSYALILIRSNADTPMNQNSPDNVFALSSYLNREQYGSRPLLYGETPYSSPLRIYKYVDVPYTDEDGMQQISLQTIPMGNVKNKKERKYARGIHGATPRYTSGIATVQDSLDYVMLEQNRGDFYAFTDYGYDVVMQPELNMLLPRMYSGDPQHIEAYKIWSGMSDENMDVVLPTARNEYGQPIADPYGNEKKPTFGQNLRYFFDYQLNHMYFRYFMWNFAGRQNDICNQYGELDAGNWISGIPMIDNARLGDQSLLPDDLGKENKGHNVFYMLPLILGLLGLFWQAFAGRRGIEQFWVVFFLFFMTGIAIVLYLNQTPLQPRERDYAFAGSFYAFAIWIGMGVAAIWNWLSIVLTHRDETVPDKKAETTAKPEKFGKSTWCAIAACVIGLIVPLQMVSQTWDDHDRSGRTAAFDYATNYLNSLEPNAIIFCNGDNDTFPLWYAQEVEGVRPDVKIINLSYLQSDWYANQQRLQSYDAAPVKFTANPEDYAYDRIVTAQVIDGYIDANPTDALTSLKAIYSDNSVVSLGGGKYVSIKYPNMYIPVNKKDILKRGNVWVDRDEVELIVDSIPVNVLNKGYMTMSEILMLDIIATNAANGWERPIYWASTVPNSYHLGLTPYLKSVGMAYQLTPVLSQEDLPVRTSKAQNVVNNYRWGVQRPGMVPYFDETAGRMLYGTRASIVRTAEKLIAEGDTLAAKGNQKAARGKFDNAYRILTKMEQNLPQHIKRYGLSDGINIGDIYVQLGKKLGDKKICDKGYKIMLEVLDRYAQYVKYTNSIRARFGNPSLTYETSLMPYYYYHFVQIYQDAGGNMATLSNMLKKKGLDLNSLKELYDRYIQIGDVGEQSDLVYLHDQITGIGQVVVDLQACTPEEYSKMPDDYKQADTLLLYYISEYNNAGGDVNALEVELRNMGIDLDRSIELFDKHMANRK